MSEILRAFAKWIANEGYRFDGVSIWKKDQNVKSFSGQSKELWYSTEQIVQEFLKSQQR